MNERDCSVYVIHAEGTNCYKIGWARDVRARLRELQIGNHCRLVVVVVFAGRGAKFEGLLHRRFQRVRVRGEWFALSDVDLDWLRRRSLDGGDVPRVRWENRLDGKNRTLCRCARCGKNVQSKHRYETLRHRGGRVIAAQHVSCADPYDGVIV